MFKTILKRTVFSPATLAAIVILCAAYCMEADYEFGILYAYEYANALGVVTFFVPIAAALPVCFIQRYFSREEIFRLALFRGSRVTYIFSHIVSTLLAVMVVVGAATVLFAGISFLHCWPEGVWIQEYTGDGMQTQLIDGEWVFVDTGEVTEVQIGYFDMDINTHFGPLQVFPSLAEHHVLKLAVEALLQMVQGSVCAMFALGAFAFLHNQYIALAVPFLLRTGLAFLSTATGLIWLDPGQLRLVGIMNETIGGGMVYVLIVWLTVTVICGGLWGFRTVWRNYHG